MTTRILTLEDLAMAVSNRIGIPEEDAMREYLIERVRPWGVPFHTDAGGNLIVEIPANDCAHDAVLLVSGHMDVVPPCHNIQPIVEQVDGDALISSDNTTVLGADDKAGLAPVLEAAVHHRGGLSPRAEGEGAHRLVTITGLIDARAAQLVVPISLAAEDEARQVARQAYLEGHRLATQRRGDPLHLRHVPQLVG